MRHERVFGEDQGGGEAVLTFGVFLLLHHSVHELQFRRSTEEEEEKVRSNRVEQLVKSSRRWLQKHGKDVHAYPSHARYYRPAGPEVEAETLRLALALALLLFILSNCVLQTPADPPPGHFEQEQLVLD